MVRAMSRQPIMCGARRGSGSPRTADHRGHLITHLVFILLLWLPRQLITCLFIIWGARTCTRSICTSTFSDNRVATLYSTQCVFFKRKENIFKTSTAHRVEYRVDTRLSEKVKVQGLRVHVRVRHKRSWRISRSVPLSTPSPRTREVLL